MTQREITGLLPFTEYTVRVAAVQSDGAVGNQSPPYLFSTPQASKPKDVDASSEVFLIFFALVSTPPEDVTVLEIAGGFINVTWRVPSMPNGEITGRYANSS